LFPGFCIRKYLVPQFRGIPHIPRTAVRALMSRRRHSALIATSTCVPTVQAITSVLGRLEITHYLQGTLSRPLFHHNVLQTALIITKRKLNFTVKNTIHFVVLFVTFWVMNNVLNPISTISLKPSKLGQSMQS